FYATVTTAGGVLAAATVTAAAGSVGWEVTAAVEADATPAIIAAAPIGTVQEAGVEVYVGGVQVPPSSLVGAWEVDRDRRASIQQAQFSVALSEWGVSPLGDPFAALGSSTGVREIEIYGTYRGNSKVYRYPLIKRAIADNVQRQVGAESVQNIETAHALDA